MLKKILIASAVLIVLMMFMIPSGADPTDMVLDQQVELEVPGTFDLIDSNHDKLAEEIRFQLGMKAYQEGQFIVTGNLEANKNGHWVAVGTTVLPFQWSPDHQRIELVFHTSNIRKQQLSGPYRVTVGLKAGNWELPSQVAGFSPKYDWNNFSNAEKGETGEITDFSKAKRAVETWADYQNVKLGSLIGGSYDYDHWQLDYKEKFGRILRFLVSPYGSIEMLRIKKSAPAADLQGNAGTK
ncbi:MAG: hypothetical protein ACM3X9_00470 [Bacillota bacterium]